MKVRHKLKHVSIVMYGHTVRMWKRMEVRKMWVEVINGEVRKLGGCRKTTEGCSLMYVHIIHTHCIHR